MTKLIADRSANRTARQFEATQWYLTVQNHIDGRELIILILGIASSDIVHHVDACEIARICYEERVVARVSVINYVTREAFLHRLDVVVLIRHDLEGGLALGPGCHTFPAL